MSIVHRVTAGLALAAVSTLSVVGLAAPAQAAPKDYANCTAMHKDFKHGVARSTAAANKQVRDGYGRPAVKPALYRVNNESDADKDGTACEA